MTKFVVLLALLAVVISSANSWPSGAPEKVCGTLSPSHGVNRSKPPSSSPFTFTQSHQDYRAGDRVKVTIKAPQGYSFKGLMIQAFDPNTNQPIGRFLAGKGLKVYDSCAAVTHTDRRGKRAATLIWEAPAGAIGGKVNFRGTILQRFSEFYEGLHANLEQL